MLEIDILEKTVQRVNVLKVGRVSTVTVSSLLIALILLIWDD